MASMCKEDKARMALDELLYPAPAVHVDLYRIALVYVALRHTDAAIEWMNKPADANSFHLATIDTEPMLNPIRRDPGFENLRERAGLTTDRYSGPYIEGEDAGLQAGINCGSEVSTRPHGPRSSRWFARVPYDSIKRPTSRRCTPGHFPPHKLDRRSTPRAACSIEVSISSSMRRATQWSRSRIA